MTIAGKCAIANAACRQFGFPNAYVNGEGIDLQSADCKTIHELSIPPEAVDFMDQFDGGQPVMAEKYPRHFANVVSDNDDAETGDVFLQCCLFGEIVYG